MAKKPAKPMNKKSMKKTKGGLIGLLKPAIQVDSPRDPQISGNTWAGNNAINGGSFTGGV